MLLMVCKAFKALMSLGAFILKLWCHCIGIWCQDCKKEKKKLAEIPLHIWKFMFYIEQKLLCSVPSYLHLLYEYPFQARYGHAGTTIPVLPVGI